MGKLKFRFWAAVVRISSLVEEAGERVGTYASCRAMMARSPLPGAAKREADLFSQIVARGPGARVVILTNPRPPAHVSKKDVN